MRPNSDRFIHVSHTGEFNVLSFGLRGQEVKYRAPGAAVSKVLADKEFILRLLDQAEQEAQEASKRDLEYSLQCIEAARKRVENF